MILNYLNSYTLLALFIILIVLQFFLLWERRRNYLRLERQNKALFVSRKINKIILEEIDLEVVAQKIADMIPEELLFDTGVLSIIDNQRKVIRRIAASQTKEASEAIKAIASLKNIQFNKIEISLDDPNNLMARAVRERKPFRTSNVYDVLGPVLTKEESRQIQEVMSTRTTLIYPISMRDKIIGVFLASTVKDYDQLSDYELNIIRNFVDESGIALQHALLYRDLKKRTEELAVANKRLLELDKLKDEFVSLASHELRTPMTVIKSYTWLLLQGKTGNMNAKQIIYLDRVYSSTNRLINLVNDMLNVSRIESGRITIDKKEVNIKQLIDDVITEMMPKAQEGKIELLVNYEQNLPSVMVDPDKIKEVIINLIGNSLKFTPENGKITISVSQKDGEVVVKVSDTGSGIDKDDIQKLFQKFGIVGNNYLRKRNSQGTGLGLYLAKSLVELHGGRMWAQSEGVGKGSSFYFTLKTTDQEGKMPEIAKITSD